MASDSPIPVNYRATAASPRSQSQSQSQPQSQSAWQSSPQMATLTATTDPHAALLQGHDHTGPLGRTRNLARSEKDDAFVKNKSSKQIERMITPYLAQHIPQQYKPQQQQDAEMPANTKYCYRHRPDLLCRKQADEPTMEQLQKELSKETQEDQQSIANVWSLFSAAPSKHRNLMLQGILAQCCFPQLSFISSSVRNLIKIDFLAALPTELGFQILRYLDTTSLCKAAQVSRRWRELADDDVVWHKMCEQHIDRKCTKCGWGLPLLDQRRLRSERKRIQLRASGVGLRDFASGVAASIEHSSKAPTQASTQAPTQAPSSLFGGSASGTKRAAPDSSPDRAAKRTCTQEDQEQKPKEPKTRPWKDVYKDRFKVGTNWKYGRFTTTILKGHTNGVMCLQSDDHILMTGSYDATVKIWDLQTGKLLRTLAGHREGIRCLQFNDAGHLVTGSLDKTVKIWDWRSGKLVTTLHAHSAGVIGIHMAGPWLASASADNTVAIHNYSTKKRFVLAGHTDWVNSVKIDLASRTVLSASDDCTVKLWDLDSGACLRTFEGHAGQVQQVLPLPPDLEIDENDFIPHSNNDASDTASLASGDARRSPTPDEPEPRIFAPKADRAEPPSYMLTGSLDGTIRLWHIPSGRCIHRFFGHVEGVWCLAVDRLRLVSGAEDKTIKIWDPRTGKNERTLAGHTGPVTCVGLSDSRLISGSEDGTVRVLCFTGTREREASPVASTEV